MDSEPDSTALAGAERGLHKQLSAGQMAMIAVGSSIGTGLLLGSGAAAHIAGPAVVLAYVVGAFVAWIVSNALGEMASADPAAGSFGVYAERYLNPWAGFVARYGYWFGVVAAVGAELVATATYLRYWFPHVPGSVWIFIAAVALLLVNLQSVGNFGRFEFWLAAFKLATIMAFILLGTALLFGGKVTPQYRAAGGFFPNGMLAPLLALSFPLFSFLGIELVAISSGEAHDRKDIPRATRLTFAMLAFAYIGATAVLVGVTPWNRLGVEHSPFVTVFDIAGLPAVSAVMNFVVLTAALSGANANLYAAGRMLFSLARGGYAPPSLGKLTASGSPRLALIVSSLGIFAALLMEHWLPESAFLYILGAALFGAMLAWIAGLAAHIAFRRQISAEALAALPMRAPGGALLSGFAVLVLLAGIISTAWVPQSRVTLICAPVYLLILTVAYWASKSRKRL